MIAALAAQYSGDTGGYERMSSILSNFQYKSAAMDYSEFAPRLYNFCKQFGLQRAHWKLASAYSPDEDQGYSLLILTKHFGTFPINVGTASGGINYTEIPEKNDMDLVIVQASHVGRASLSEKHDDHQESEQVNGEQSHACSYQLQALYWYQNEYQFAQNGISLKKYDGHYQLIIDNQLLDDGDRDGLFLNLDQLIQKDTKGNYVVLKHYSTAKVFMASDEFIHRAAAVNLQEEEIMPIGQHLNADLFYFKRNDASIPEQELYRSKGLNTLMPQIITSPWPELELAKASIQIEFDHTCQTIAKDKNPLGRNLVYIGVMHQDIAQSATQTFTPTLVIPWAAYIRQSDGTEIIIEQPELVAYLRRNSLVNSDEIDLDAALQEAEQREILPAFRAYLD